MGTKRKHMQEENDAESSAEELLKEVIKQLIKIVGIIGQINPSATIVINNYYGTCEKDVTATKATVAKEDKSPVVDRDEQKERILNYVDKLCDMVIDSWRKKYLSLWCDVLSLLEVNDEIYEIGKQVGTRFNRNLVANIIHLLGNYEGPKTGIFKQWSAKHIAITLEGTHECSTRAQLGMDPSPVIKKAILKLMLSPKYSAVASL